MTTRHVHHALSLTLTAMAARLPGTVWAVLLGGIFILACTTTPPETLAPTDEPRAEITATLPAGMADPTSTPESDSIGSLALLETLPGPPLSPDAIATLE